MEVMVIFVTLTTYRNTDNSQLSQMNPREAACLANCFVNNGRH